VIHSFLALAAFGGGGGGGNIDFTGVSATGQNYGSHAAQFVVYVIIVLILAGIAAVLATSRGKSDMMQFIALAAFVAVCVGIIFTWGTTASAAALTIGMIGLG
jgi:hypothetical protein